MSNDADLLRIGDVGVLLGKYLRIRGVLDVVEPALHDDVIRICRQVAEDQHGSVRRRRAPGFELDVSRRANLTQWIETLRNQLENASVVQIVPERVVEGAQQFAVTRILAGRLEVGNGDADSFDA